MITNEEKALKIATDYTNIPLTLKKRIGMCMQMAQWKDEQFTNQKQALIDKMDSILDEAEKMRESAIGREKTGGWYWRKWAEWGYRKAIEAMEKMK